MKLIISKLPTHLFNTLLNAELSSVCFVRDYIELHFDGPVLRLNGKVLINGKLLASGGMRSAEADPLNELLRSIGKKVVSFIQDDSLSLKICFDSGCEVRVDSEMPGQEFAHFISYPDKTFVVFDGT